MKRLSLEEIEIKASKLRSHLGLNEQEPIHTKSILRKENILTVYRPLSDKAYGLSLKYNDRKFILVNSRNRRCRQHFTIAHEFFHLYFEEKPTPHLCGSGNVKSIEEFNADLFASAFLMPRIGIIDIIPIEELNKIISLATIIKLEQYFSVSRSSLLIRLKTLRLLSLSEYQKLSELPVIETARAYGYNTALYEAGNENLVIGDFGANIRNLYEFGKISEGHYLELLNSISDGED
jgi:Zn-dependent peptidase ImmA (M78 family)